MDWLQQEWQQQPSVQEWHDDPLTPATDKKRLLLKYSIVIKIQLCIDQFKDASLPRQGRFP
jgi:hypothetical protein